MAGLVFTKELICGIERLGGAAPCPVLAGDVAGLVGGGAVLVGGGAVLVGGVLVGAVLVGGVLVGAGLAVAGLAVGIVGLLVVDGLAVDVLEVDVLAVEIPLPPRIVKRRARRTGGKSLCPKKMDSAIALPYFKGRHSSLEPLTSTTTPPSVLTHITQIHEFHLHRVILHIDHIPLRTPSIASTVPVRALDVLYVRQRGILPGKLIEKNLVSLAGPLLNARFHEQTTPLLRLVRPTREAAPHESAIRLKMCLEHITTRGALLHFTSYLACKVKVGHGRRAILVACPTLNLF